MAAGSSPTITGPVRRPAFSHEPAHFHFRFSSRHDRGLLSPSHTSLLSSDPPVSHAVAFCYIVQSNLPSLVSISTHRQQLPTRTASYPSCLHRGLVAPRRATLPWSPPLPVCAARWGQQRRGCIRRTGLSVRYIIAKSQVTRSFLACSGFELHLLLRSSSRSRGDCATPGAKRLSPLRLPKRSSDTVASPSHLLRTSFISFLLLCSASLSLSRYHAHLLVC